jgi:beta-galactosidase
MIKKLCLSVFYFFFLSIGFSQTMLFDNDWLFHKGGLKGAQLPEYNDSGWRNVDLPHDWSIEDLQGTDSPFDKDAVSQVSSGYTVGGTGWYRKYFTIPEQDKGKCVCIQFDGVYMNSEFWLNGEYIGSHPYGYTSFWFDITREIKFGKKNLLVVVVRNEGENSRWYSGSGIYRHVWLKILEPVHIAQWGTVVVTAEANSKEALLNVRTPVNNKSAEEVELKLTTRILDETGAAIAKSETVQMLGAGTSTEIDQNFAISQPKLWAPESPVLYRVVNEVYAADKLQDKTEIRFGIRTLDFSVTQGFLLNGIPVKLKGGCVHHDNGPLGSRAYDRAEERRVELLKASGFNAIRCAHNPPSPSFLDACDRLGMLVMDEAFDMWRLANNPFDYHLYFDENWEQDIESFVKRDRNHPSVIIWSIGNEIRDMENPEVIEVGKKLAARVRSIDPTRPVTAAVNSLRPQKDPFFAILDVGGYNYAADGFHFADSVYVADHLRVPDRIIVSTESFPLEAFGAWIAVQNHPYVIGDFVWTSFDHIGEASIGWRGYNQEDFFPWNLAWCGDIDLCGWKRPQSFYRDALWKDNQLSVFVAPPEPTFPLNPNKQVWSKWGWYDVLDDWNWEGFENRPFRVSVYSSCDQVELFLNGKSMGKKTTSRETRFMATWEVPYMAGELKALGYNGTGITATSFIQTAGDIKTIKLTPDRKDIKANGQDLSYITVELVDVNGVRNPKSENLITFGIEGEGSIVAVGNANPVSIESFQQPLRKAWRGRCMVVVKSDEKPGTIKLTASVDGLPSSFISIATR